jgi:hypothetical protein
VITAKSFYDVVVVGGSLGALATGALLARRGFRVAWIRHDDRPAAYTYEGATLLRRAAALPFVDAPAFRRLMAELALLPVVRRKLITPDPLFQVVLPDHRVDVRAGTEALLTELSREFPEITRAMEEFYAGTARAMGELDAIFGADVQWPPEGFFERREAARAAAGNPFGRRGNVGDPLGDFPAGHPFRTFVMAQARFASNLDPDAMTPLRLVRAHGAAIRGAAFHEGGRDALQRFLEEKILQHGGDVRPRDRVARIETHRGRVRAVDIATSEERLGCSFVVTSLDLAGALRLAEHSPSRATTERLLARAPRYYRYVLNAIVRAEGVPPGMGARVFGVADRARPLAEENLLYIESSPPDGDGRVVLTITALLTRSGVEEGEGYLRRQRPRMLRALGEIVPFLDRNLLAIDSPHDGLPLEDVARGTTVTLKERWRGEPEPMAVLEAPDPEGFLGVCAAQLRTEIKGLLLVGPQVVAGLGEEGEFMSALGAARIVTRSDRSKEKLRRELWSKVDL